jgi:hypothetical protein
MLEGHQLLISYAPRCVQVTSYNLSMREIDTVQNPGEYVPSATEIIIRKVRGRCRAGRVHSGAPLTAVRWGAQGHADMLVDPLVVTVLDAKWERFAKMQYVVHAVAYLAFVVVQVVLVWLRADRELTHTAARAALEYISLLLAVGAPAQQSCRLQNPCTWRTLCLQFSYGRNEVAKFPVCTWLTRGPLPNLCLPRALQF